MAKVTKATTKSKTTKSSKESEEPVKCAIRKTSPLDAYYKTWSSLGRFNATVPDGLLSIIKSLAKLSKNEFFYSAVPLPGSAETELRKLLAEDVSNKKYDELGMRRKILHQFKYYLRNQTEHRKKINDDAYALWKRAKHLLESEVAWECKDKMSQTTYRQKTIDAIFDLATKACASTWEEYWQKMTKRPKPQDIESRVERFARNEHFIDRPDIVDAYRATLNGDPFIYSTYAQSIGVRCDQENGVLTIGRTNLNIPARSEVAWTIIRLFVSSNNPKGITVLYPGWDGTFSKNVNNDKNKFRSSFVKAANACNRQNNKSYRLIDPLKPRR